MKNNIISLIAVAAILAVLLVGCGAKHREQEAKKLAEEYLSELKVQVSDETLYLTDAETENYGEMISFIAYSEKYGDDFRIYVNTDDSISDSYFSVSLKDIARQEFSGLLGSVFPDESLEFELSVDDVVGVSGRTFDSVQEAHEALDNATGLINVVITQSDSSEISDGDLDSLLNAMQKASFYGALSIADDVRVFHISETEINYTRTDDGPGEVRYYDWVPGQNK